MDRPHRAISNQRQRPQVQPPQVQPPQVQPPQVRRLQVQRPSSTTPPVATPNVRNGRTLRCCGEATPPVEYRAYLNYDGSERWIRRIATKNLNPPSRAC